jgi:hypothetical protein
MRQIEFQAFRLQTLEVVSAQFLIGRITTEHVVNRNQDLVCDGDDGAFVTESSLKAIVFFAEITILLAGGGQGGLDQSRALVWIARTNLALASFTGALVLPRAKASPGCSWLLTC